MFEVNKKRMLKLIDFLMKLEPEKFDFNDVVADWDENLCGTVCCAVGWFPEIFPNYAYYIESSVPGVAQISIDGVNEAYFANAAKEILGISVTVARLLFAPNCQSDVSLDLEDCNAASSPTKVAVMLQKFCYLVEKGEIANHVLVEGE